VKNLLVVAVALAIASTGCKKKDDAGAGSATASAAPDAAPMAVDAAGGGAAMTPAGAFAAAFDPVNSKLDHVSRARTGCEQRTAWLDMIKAMDQAAAGVASLQKAIDEMGDPCDEGNIKAIEAKMDEAKQALDALPK
jgi:hypothetical protein